MKTRTITIHTINGDRQIEAEVYGNWAIHPAYLKTDSFDKKSHTVTFIPEGKSIGWGSSRVKTRAFVRDMTHKGVGEKSLADIFGDNGSEDERIANLKPMLDLMKKHDVYQQILRR